MEAHPSPRPVPLKERRLHKPYMYKTVFEGGKVFRSPPITLRYFQADQDLSRVGFIIRKRAGKAVLRNSIRRTLRRSFQEALPSLREGAWLVFDVADKAGALRRGELRAHAVKLLRSLPASDAGQPGRGQS